MIATTGADPPTATAKALPALTPAALPAATAGAQPAPAVSAPSFGPAAATPAALAGPAPGAQPAFSGLGRGAQPALSGLGRGAQVGRLPAMYAVGQSRVAAPARAPLGAAEHFSETQLDRYRYREDVTPQAVEEDLRLIQ